MPRKIYKYSGRFIVSHSETDEISLQYLVNSFRRIHILKDRIVTYDVGKVTPIEILINQPVHEEEIIVPTTNIKANNGCIDGLCCIFLGFSVVLFIYCWIIMGVSSILILTIGLGIAISTYKFLMMQEPELKTSILHGKPTVYYIPEENKDIYNSYNSLYQLLCRAKIRTGSCIPSNLCDVSNIDPTKCSIDTSNKLRLVFYPERIMIDGCSFDYSEVMFIYVENQSTVVNSCRHDRKLLKILEEKWEFTDDAGNQDLTKADNYLQCKVLLHSINFTFPNGISTSLSSVYTNELKEVYDCLVYLKLHLPPLRVNEYLST